MLFGLKMKIRNKIIEFYGNRKYKFDLVLSIILTILLILLKINFVFVDNIIKNVNESSISFLGIVVGFLLTTFSLLFLYDPKSSEKLRRIRELPVYKKMLSSFISTAFIIVLLSLGLLMFNALSFPTNLLSQSIIFTLILFSVLRVFKCIFYLYAIIELS